MDELAIEAKLAMEKSINSLKGNLATLRTGRANPSVLEHIMVDYYGDKIGLNQICAVSSPEPRQILIKPYDKNDVKSVVAALNSSELGINPINDGTSIRLIFPPLTEERRREISKVAKKYAEESKVAVRNIRRDYIDLARSDEEVSEDITKRIEKEIQEVVDEAIKNIDQILAEKDKEIMSI